MLIKVFFSNKEITETLNHDRGAIRRILKILIRNNWLKEEKIGASIIYVRNFFTRQSYLDNMIKLEIINRK